VTVTLQTIVTQLFAAEPVCGVHVAFGTKL